MTQSFIELENISKTFPGVKALEGVNFVVYPGEVHSLVGENGAGKSTLMKIISGDYQPDKGGEIIIKGEKTELSGPIDSIRKGISVIYQDFSLFTNLSVAENIVMSQIIENKDFLVNWDNIEKKAQEALDILESDIDPKEIVENLPISKQQMVAIASAISQDAEMIIMDEPTSTLSNEEINALYEVIKRLKSNNIAIVFISHKMEELFKVSDRFTILRDGQFIHTCKKNEINRHELIAKMVGREVIIENLTNLDEKTDVRLEVKNLSKAGNFKDISFKLHKGEILGITGLGGAGRSELIETIFGITPADSGEVFIEGVKVDIKNPWNALDLGIGLIPESRQTQGLILDKNLESNIALPLLDKFLNRFGLLDEASQKSSVKEGMDLLDVRPNNPSLLANQLSGGNQQKVVIAKWLSTDPQILIVDEPTNGVDVGAKSEIHKILRDLAMEGRSLIVVSSELPEVLSISDRILVMRRGRISGEFINDNLTQEQIMEKAVID